MNQQSNTGFTIVELMLAMTFISLLLMGIALTTIQISNIYNKGITLREVNQVGRSISEDVNKTISQTNPFNIDGGPNTDYISSDAGGRLCAGNYTYVWNLAETLRSTSPGTVTGYNKYISPNTEQIRLVKVNDPGGSLCRNPESDIDSSKSVELLNSSDRNLAIHKFAVVKSTEDTLTNQALYAMNIIIGTNDDSQLDTSNNVCKPPSDGAGNEDYCSVNEFNIVVRAGN